MLFNLGCPLGGSSSFSGGQAGIAATTVASPV